jgi:hypothetical protein
MSDFPITTAVGVLDEKLQYAQRSRELITSQILEATDELHRLQALAKENDEYRDGLIDAIARLSQPPKVEATKTSDDELKWSVGRYYDGEGREISKEQYEKIVESVPEKREEVNAAPEKKTPELQPVTFLPTGALIILDDLVGEVGEPPWPLSPSPITWMSDEAIFEPWSSSLQLAFRTRLGALSDKFSFFGSKGKIGNVKVETALGPEAPMRSGLDVPAHVDTKARAQGTAPSLVNGLICGALLRSLKEWDGYLDDSTRARLEGAITAALHQPN